jgi:HK97 family phage portal protein
VLETPSKLGPDEKDKVRREFEKATAGLSNMHKIAILDLGQKFTALDMPLADAQYIETKIANIADIARFLKMPLYKLGEGKQAYNSNEQQNLDYLGTTLDPICVQHEQEYDLKLFSRREQTKWYGRINRAALLRTDLAALRAYLEGMVQNGIYTQNEARAYLEMNRYKPGAENPADRLLVSRNYVHLDDLSKTVGAQAQPNAR